MATLHTLSAFPFLTTVCARTVITTQHARVPIQENHVVVAKTRNQKALDFLFDRWQFDFFISIFPIYFSVRNYFESRVFGRFSLYVWSRLSFASKISHAVKSMPFAEFVALFGRTKNVLHFCRVTHENQKLFKAGDRKRIDGKRDCLLLR